MNFLAHAYLSFDNDQILVGNMMGDFVKGRQKEAYPADVRRGIELHRAIDSYTDAHPVTAVARTIFRPVAGLYAGAFLDVSFDYFLANDEKIKAAVEWKSFAVNSYTVLMANESYLPKGFAKILPNMVKYDWLYNYRSLPSVEKSFNSVSRRAKYLPDNLDVQPVFLAAMPELQLYYEKFFPELEQFARDWLKEK